LGLCSFVNIYINYNSHDHKIQRFEAGSNQNDISDIATIVDLAMYILFEVLFR